ncbi:hypothetical protein F5X98DRAFT_381362 [Xylaria grammica]|nr:hypothetical protein F5X98DRAFT_381362 [Xylaria grammica]
MRIGNVENHDSHAAINDKESYSSMLPLLAPNLHEQFKFKKQYTESMSDQAQAKVNVISNLATEVSVSLAKAAKDDSYSMEGIAVMMMLFLPATFFSALFAMPVIDWDGGTPALKWVFWIYLAAA